MHIAIIHAFVLFLAAAVVSGDIPLGACGDGNADADVATVVMLIKDLVNNVPFADGLNYCNTVDYDDVKMYGFAKCKPGDGSSMDLSYCFQCLELVGDYLVKTCDDTGVGHAWDIDSSCY